MANSMVIKIAGASQKSHSISCRILSFSLAVCILMVLIPILYVLFGKFISGWISFSCPRVIEVVLACITGLLGILVLLWSVWTQWMVGRGGPVPVVPTTKLITSGPYALCRNPMFLGCLFYVFAFGLVFGNLVVAIVCAVLEMALGVSYYKGIEEKELLMRFGDEYQRYKDKTPFLIPRFRVNRDMSCS